MRKSNPLIMFSIWIGLGVWLALVGYIKIVIFLIAAAVLMVMIQFGVGWLLVGIGRIREKSKNKKSN
jgi:hypothetical protein